MAQLLGLTLFPLEFIGHRREDGAKAARDCAFAGPDDDAGMLFGSWDLAIGRSVCLDLCPFPERENCTFSYGNLDCGVRMVGHRRSSCSKLTTSACRRLRRAWRFIEDRPQHLRL